MWKIKATGERARRETVRRVSEKSNFAARAPKEDVRTEEIGFYQRLMDSSVSPSPIVSSEDTAVDAASLI